MCACYRSVGSVCVLCTVGVRKVMVIVWTYACIHVLTYDLNNIFNDDNKQCNLEHFIHQLSRPFQGLLAFMPLNTLPLVALHSRSQH